MKKKCTVVLTPQTHHKLKRLSLDANLQIQQAAEVAMKLGIEPFYIKYATRIQMVKDGQFANLPFIEELGFE